ncbi:MAG: YdbL family protein [Desulfobulbaceae bacterium]|nr:YdbL family protein [Desulfobulbaceae bacterium]
MNRWSGRALSLLCLILFGGCTLAKVDVEVVSERTALENQVLGTYNAIDREMLLVASVRGVDTQGRPRKAPETSRGRQDAVAAMQLINFLEDDIAAFKALGWAGENRDGLLTPFSMDKKRVPDSLAEVANRFQAEEMRAVIDQVNGARMAVMQRVIFLGENLSEADLPQVQKIFGKLNIENAAPGEKVQSEEGSWVEKK